MRNPITPLGGTEMEVLRHVWRLGEATVREVHDTMDRDLAYTTVMTVMKNLADKSLLTYRKEGNAYVYSAAVPQEEVRGNLLSGILDKVFGGSPLSLVQALVREQSLTKDERNRLRALIDEMEQNDD